METVRHFEDIPALFAKHDVRYLIICGLAFVYHALPRYTKDIDLCTPAIAKTSESWSWSGSGGIRSDRRTGGTTAR